MRITCPSCQATYEVPDAMLRGVRRKMRCARCATQWVPQEALADSAAPPATLPPAGPMPEIPPPPLQPAVSPGVAAAASAATEPAADGTGTEKVARRLAIYPPLVELQQGRRETRGLGLAVAGWVATLVLLAGLGTGFVLGRERIQALWPPSQRLYLALGLR